MIVDTVISGDDLRAELLRRYDLYADKNVEFTRRRNPVYPV
jgi:hypothetical protein